MLRLLAAVVAASALAGCMAGQGSNSSRAAVGAFAGPTDAGESAGSAALAEALRGGLVAGDIGSDLRGEDRRMAVAAEYQALEYAAVGQPVTWRGSNGRISGEVTAAAPYRVGSQDCRQYIHTVRISETTRTARGTACREQDGRWGLLG